MVAGDEEQWIMPTFDNATLMRQGVPSGLRSLGYFVSFQGANCSLRLKDICFVSISLERIGASCIIPGRVCSRAWAGSCCRWRDYDCPDVHARGQVQCI